MQVHFPELELFPCDPSLFFKHHSFLFSYYNSKRKSSRLSYLLGRVFQLAQWPCLEANMRLIPAGTKPSPPFASCRCSPSLCFPLPHCSPGYKPEAWASSPGALSASPLPPVTWGSTPLSTPPGVFRRPPGECSLGQASEGDGQ